MTEAPWLEEVPESWEVRRMAWLGRWTGGGTPSKSEPSFWDGAIPWVSPKDMKVRLIRDTVDHVSQAGVRASSTRMVPAGSVLIVTRSGILRHSLPVAITGRPVAINQDLKALQPVPDVDGAFVAYWIEANQLALLSLWRKEGTTVESLETDLVRETPLPLPAPDQQRAIAAFLDRETAKIDTLIEKKRRLLDLLEEKRTALITRAVTRGLDLDVPMKDSGVEWIGEIPEHWEVASLRRVARVVDCKHRTPTYVAEGYPLVSTTEVKAGILDLSVCTRFVGTEDLADMAEGPRLPRQGDIIYSRNASLGAAALVETVEPFCMGQDVVLIRTDEHPDYLRQQLNSPAVARQVEAVGVGSTFARINVATIRGLYVVLPPKDEQWQIAGELRAVTADIVEIGTKIKKAIAFLQEYRSALIYSAANGRIEPPRAVASGDTPTPVAERYDDV